MLKLIMILISLVFVVWIFVVEPNMLTVKKYIIKDKELAGLKVVFAADFHVGKKHVKRLAKTVDLINEQNPDLVLLGGDFVKGHNEKTTLPIEIIAHEISHIKSPNGIYTVLGNHDMWVVGDKSRSIFEQNGINVILNGNVPITVNGKKIYIAGVEDMTTGFPDLSKAFENTEKPVILLSHQPDIFPKVEDDVNLILAGHTHGGQVVFPFIGALLVPSAYGQKFLSGLIEEDDKKMVVTKGIGTSILPVRFNCRPEINIILFE